MVLGVRFRAGAVGRLGRVRVHDTERTAAAHAGPAPSVARLVGQVDAFDPDGPLRAVALEAGVVFDARARRGDLGVQEVERAHDAGRQDDERVRRHELAGGSRGGRARRAAHSERKADEQPGEHGGWAAGHRSSSAMPMISARSATVRLIQASRNMRSFGFPIAIDS
jgi:hypothetical protein